MPRLPKPGSDQGKWGEILNDYLSQSHTDTGTLKDNTIGTNQLQTNSITTARRISLDTNLGGTMNT